MTQETTAPAHANTTHRHDELEHVMAQAIPLFEAEDDQAVTHFAEFIDRRVDELSAGSSEDKGAIGSEVLVEEGFIAEDRNMYISMLSKPVVMDDRTAYSTAAPYVKHFFADMPESLSQRAAYVNAVIRAANFGQAAYFKSYVGDFHQREQISGDFISDEPSTGANSDVVSISDFEGAAMCLERAALVHNTLHIFGLRSTLVLGKMGDLAEGKDGIVRHAFLVVEGSDGTKYLFDPTNPRTLKNTEGVIIQIEPNTAKLELDENGEQELQLAGYELNNDGEAVQTESHTLKYIMPPELQV